MTLVDWLILIPVTLALAGLLAFMVKHMIGSR